MAADTVETHTKHLPNNGLETGETIKYLEPGIAAEILDSVSHEFENKDCHYFWRRVVKDLKNKKLIPIKILFFFKYATLYVLYPFLTLHMDFLGLDEWEIGINQATSPIVAILGPPFVGIIADKIGNFKVLLSFMTLCNAGIALLLLLVPQAREQVLLPNYMTFELSCNLSPASSHRFILQSIESSSCSVNSQNTPWKDIPQSPIFCGTVCPAMFDPNMLNESSLDLLPRVAQSSAEYIKDTTFRLPDGHEELDIDLDDKLILVCERSLLGETCSLGHQRQAYQVELKPKPKRALQNNETDRIMPSSFYFTTLSYQQLTLVAPISNGSKTDDIVTELALQIEGDIAFDNLKHSDPVCKAGEPIEQANCTRKCFVQYDRNLFCKNIMGQGKVYDVVLTFSLYTAFRLLLGFTSATAFIMFEGAVLSIMKQYGGDYGLQRVSATTAAIIFAPLSGLILHKFGFRPIFYFYAVLQALSALLSLKIDLKFKKPAEKVITNLWEIISQPEIIIFFIAMLWSGVSWGYIETFLFLFLKTIGGSTILMGLTISVGGIVGLPLLLFSRPIIKRFGHVNILCLGLFFYGIRYFGFSIIEDPWLCLPFEAMEGITASLALTAAATYAVALSSLETIASVQGIFGCLYFGIGKGLGSLLGGILIKKVGHRDTFRIFGLSSFVGCALYMIANLLYIRRQSAAREKMDMNLWGIGDREADANHNSDDKPPLNTAQIDKVSGGYNGPLEVNQFTDVPLDEEKALRVANNNRTNQSETDKQESKETSHETENNDYHPERANNS